VFETEIAALKLWICENVKLKSLENTWDDRSQEAAFLISPFGLGETITNPGYVILKQKHKIYIQYKGTEFKTLIAYLTAHWKCGNPKLGYWNDDSATVFKELSTKEYSSRTFNFAYIVFEISENIMGIKCNPC